MCSHVSSDGGAVANEGRTFAPVVVRSVAVDAARVLRPTVVERKDTEIVGVVAVSVRAQGSGWLSTQMPHMCGHCCWICVKKSQYFIRSP